MTTHATFIKAEKYFYNPMVTWSELAVSGDLKYVVFSEDSSIRCVDWTTGKHQWVHSSMDKHMIIKLKIVDELVVALSRHSLGLYNLSDGHKIKEFKIIQTTYNDFAITNNNELLVTYEDMTDSIGVFNLTDYKFDEIMITDSNLEYTKIVALNDNSFIVGSHMGIIMHYDRTENKIIAQAQPNMCCSIKNIELLADGTRFITMDDDRNFILWSLTSNRTNFELLHKYNMKDIIFAFAHDESQIIIPVNDFATFLLVQDNIVYQLPIEPESHQDIIKHELFDEKIICIDVIDDNLFTFDNQCNIVQWKLNNYHPMIKAITS